MNIDRIRSLYLEKKHQLLSLDKDGIIQSSCNSLVNIDEWIGTPIYENIPFFETLKGDIESLEMRQIQYYNCFSFSFNGLYGSYDIILQKEEHEGEEFFICTIEDRTEQYEYWQSIQQERNESLINKEIISKQAFLLRTANQEITDSINYAKRIQQKMLPEKSKLHSLLKNYFLIYKPKDIVSGDFYWIQEVDDQLIFCVADATGHGVPGAITSVIGTLTFNDAISNLIEISPSTILNYTRLGIIETLSQEDQTDHQFDGIDAALCSLNKSRDLLEFAGAYNPLHLVTPKKEQIAVYNSITQEELVIDAVMSNETNSLFEISGDKIPISLYYGKEVTYSNYRLKVEKGDRVFLSSDGYRDQFGGQFIKKIGNRRYKELLLETSKMEIDVQKMNLNVALESWRGKQEQIDDICVLGVEI